MNRIKELRTKNGISQADLAKIGNVSKSALSGYETEKYEASLHTYRKFAEYFGVTLDYLLGGDDPAQKTELFPHPEALDRFARLDDVDRIKALAYMDGLLAGEKYSRPSKRAAG